jgi:uncharacterized protein YjbI with pentapeptide repeats
MPEDELCQLDNTGIQDMQFSNRSIYNESNASAYATKPLLQKLRFFVNLSPEHLLNLYAAEERNFQGVNLSKQILSGVDLREADLSGAKLEHTVLERADLTRVNLRRADLRRADLRRAELVWANLREANLQGANLRGADLSGADLSGADLTGADLGGAILPDGSILLTSDPSSLLSYSGIDCRS